ncbi:MAG TPA: hypothetical protein DD670_07615 [Planctomycetaceae bacterium]|nr:hypothetical protein [Planctomycetaceae bacterium]
MCANTYQSVLDGFQDLAIQIGSRLFDIRWHNVSGVRVEFRVDGHGGWSKAGFPRAGDAMPFDPAKRRVVGQLCLPFTETGDRFSLGFDPVTIPSECVATEAVKGEPSARVGDRFRELAARAGIALPLPIRDPLVDYIPVFNPEPACLWYALLFAYMGEMVVQAGVPQREVTIQTPLQLSVEVIRRFKLDTNEPDFSLLGGMDTKTPKKPRATKEAANDLALTLLTNPAYRTTRALAEKIGCSTGLVTSLPAWQAYQKGLEARKPRAPKAVTLSDAVLAREGRADPDLAMADDRDDQAELAQLISEQAADKKAERHQYPRRKQV